MNLSDYIAGEYQQQYQYKSFLPSTVDHEWQLDNAQVLTALSNADRALGELNAFAQLVPDIDFFIRMHITKEATESNRLEGTRTNMEEAFLDVNDIDLEKRNDWVEVQNYINAINFAIDALDKLPLSNRLLKQTHAILLQGVRGELKQPGEFRHSQNWIGRSLQQAVFVPPTHEKLLDLMGDMEKFIHNEQLAVPHLVKIAILHYQFETIHPFLDGNGRLGRLMIALYLASFNLLHKPALYLSDYFERNRIEYVDRLMAVREKDKLDEWILFFLQGVYETAQHSVQVFKNILALKQRLESEVLPYFSTRRQFNAQHLIKALYQLPVIEIKAATKLLNVETNTASYLIKDLVKYGVLEEMTGKQRNQIFIFKEYLRIFNTTTRPNED